MATKTLGFRLEVKGQPQTLTQLDQINKKLAETQSKIKAIKGAKIDLTTNFDKYVFEDAIRTLNKVQSTKLSPEITKELKNLKSELKALKIELENTQTQLGKLKSPQVDKTSIDQANLSLDSLNGSAVSASQNVSKLRLNLQNVGTQEALDLAKALATVDINLQKVRGQKLVIKSDKTITDSAKSELLAPLIAQEKELVTQSKQVTREIDIVTRAFVNQANNIPEDSIIGLQQKLSALTLEYNKLSAAQLDSATGQNLRNEIKSTTDIISEREQAVGNFRRNVGNYKSSILGILPDLEKLQRAGVVAQNNIAGVFKADLAARADQIEAELKVLVDEFNKLGTAMAKAGERSKVLSQIDDRARELASVRGSLDQTGSAFSRLSGKLLSVSDIVTGGLIGGGILAFAGAVKSFAQGSYQEFVQAETALAKINQQLIVTGNSSGKTAEGLKQTSKELEVLTGIDGDQVLNDVTSTLLKFGNVQSDVFDRAQKAAIDLSATLGGDLKGAAQIVGKALEDPEKAIGRLAKAGVILDAETAKAVKNAIKSNDVYKAQTLILGALESKFSGVAEAVQNTDLKNVRQFTVDLNNLKEAVGKGIIGAFNSIVSTFREFSNGTLFLKAGAKETQAAINELNTTFTKEKTIIEESFKALRDDNIERDEKKKILDNLIAKYPEYLSQLDLEHKSNEELIKIEAQLTETVKKNIFERVLARAKESAAAAEDAERIRLALLTVKNFDDLSFTDRLKLTIDKQFGSSNTIDEAFRKESAKSKERLEALKLQNKNLADTLKKNLEIEFGVIDDTKVLAINNIKSDVNRAASASDEISDVLAKQLERIKELQKQYSDLSEDLKIKLIDNDFDQQIATSTRSFKDQIKTLQVELDKLEIKPIKTKTDTAQITEIKKILTILGESINTETDRINTDRQKILDEATKKLQATRDEVLRIINEVNQTDVQIQISEFQFDFDQTKREIEVQFNSNLDELNADFAEGLLSEEEYTNKSKQLEINKFEAIDKLFRDSKDEFIKNLNLQAKAELDIIEQTKQQKIKAIKETLTVEQQKIDIDFVDGKINLDDAINQKIGLAQKAAIQIKAIQSESKKDRQKIEQDLQSNINKISDDGLQAQKDNVDALNEYKALKGKEEEAREKERIKQIKDSSIALAEELANTLFSIDNERSERQYTRSVDAANKEYDNRIKLAKGNSAEEERINRERDQKLKDLERAQAKRRQSAAVSESIIQGALSIIKAFATLGPIGAAIATPFIIATTALNIAKIKSQKFAKGAYFNTKGVGGFTGASQAPPDETGERPIGTGILHADEFLATAKQTRRERPLFRILDKDRLRTNAGQPSTLWEDIEDYAAHRRSLIYAIPNPKPRNFYSEIYPVILPFGSYKNQAQKVEFSDDQLEKMAHIISKEIKQGTYEGTMEGTKQGSMLSAKQMQRIDNTLKRRSA